MPRTQDMSKMMDAALAYRKMGFSVIPIIPGDKIPPQGFPVMKYRTQFATDDEVREWWSSEPKRNVGIITGKLSNLFVVDIDTDEGKEIIEPLLPENLETPMAITPRGGKHLYFLHEEGFTIGTRVIPGVDFRGEGGYVVVAPSVNGGGKAYKWLIPLTTPALRLPAALKDILNKRTLSSIYREDVTTAKPVTNVTHETNVTLFFTEGTRDENIFSVAMALSKGGMSYPNALKCLEIIASNCQPPFPLHDTKLKLDSAVQRIARKGRNITGEIREWALVTSGIFSVTMAYSELHLLQKEEKTAGRVALLRMVKDKEIEKVTGKHGWYRRVEKQCEEIDYLSAPEDAVDIQLPLGIHELVEILPGNIIILSGEPNTGKTSWLFNLVKMNMHRFDVHYFNSEMGKEELRKRLLKIEDVPINGWRCKFYERSSEFADVIKPGNGNINIIDYLEIYSDFWEVGRFIAEIHNKLDGALAFIAIQKNPNTNVGLGGYRTLEKARLALALSHGRLDIVKAKNWKTPENPNGKYCEFKIIQGGVMYETSGWLRDK